MSCGMSMIFDTSVIKIDIGNTVIANLLFSQLYYNCVQSKNRISLTTMLCPIKTYRLYRKITVVIVYRDSPDYGLKNRV